MSAVSDSLYLERKQNNFILNNCTPSEYCWPVHRAFPFCLPSHEFVFEPSSSSAHGTCSAPIGVNDPLCSYTNVPLLLQCTFVILYANPFWVPVLGNSLVLMVPSHCGFQRDVASHSSRFLLDYQSQAHRLPYKWIKILNSNALYPNLRTYILISASRSSSSRKHTV